MNLTLSAENIDEYAANFMSDGEKVVLYIVGQVLTAPENCFIIVDEPEIFLNKNILNKLWYKLETLKSDCKFIYLTHDLDFAIDRQYAYKYWIKSYTKENFDFSEIENNEIPEKLTMELLGSQKNILFCEGKND
jgi:energy-coupling factor transporter ATP-binding protein EcfA2